MIGGAIGTATGLSGAAATSHGLALLGGGAIANGGLGMAGGTLVIGTAGGGIGGAYGLRLGNAYLGGDKSFSIDCIRDGNGPAIIYSTGFLTEADNSWESWRRLIDTAYPNAPVYRVRWGAKDLKDLSVIAGQAGVGGPAAVGVWKAALHVTRKATMRIGPLGTGRSASQSLEPRSRSVAGSSGHRGRDNKANECP